MVSLRKKTIPLMCTMTMLLNLIKPFQKYMFINEYTIQNIFELALKDNLRYLIVYKQLSTLFVSKIPIVKFSSSLR